ncbi:ABC transporter substrate-binding protein [Virgibacillus dokdonensis]|uniref:Corrinoid ABC transporter substrate-binding protein n=1 Tax=Virgibacillus dokdonensis TaxID=302167 RepID=A0A2K9J5K7_9BACI|nr:ABC transporter substrate-binding protein [Virgibacillus dokdonensis]AUJ24320.1 corrinoid ABC transporter substrate-binding protein [Virgibacillus dokdonensis]
MKNIIISSLFISLLLLIGCNTSNETKEEKTQVLNSHYPLSYDVFNYEGDVIQQTIENEPKRVLVIGSAMAELMVKFDLQDKVVGFGYDDQTNASYQEEIKKMPLLSEMWPSKESIIALKPDLIFSVASAFREDMIGSIPSWNEKNIPTLPAINFNIGRSKDSYFDEIKNFGRVFNIEDQTNKYINEQESRIKKIADTIDQAQEKPKVLFISHVRDKYYYYSPNWCMVDEMIELANGEFVNMSDQPYIELSAEAIIAENPDKIVLTQFQKQNEETTLHALLGDKQLKNVHAVKNKDVLVVDYTNAVNGSPEIANLYEDVAKFIQPKQFSGAEL